MATSIQGQKAFHEIHSDQGSCANGAAALDGHSEEAEAFPLMSIDKNRLDQVVGDARRTAEKRAAGYREQALKLFPWVCGVCARAFTHSNLQLLEVHHKNGNHDDNPADGSNWELLCTYCHEHEHSKLKDAAGRTDAGSGLSTATHNPFADLKARMAAKTKG